MADALREAAEIYCDMASGYHCPAHREQLMRAYIAGASRHAPPADDGEPVTAEFLAGLGFTPAPHHRNRYRDVRTEFAVERIGMADGVTLRVWSQVRTGLAANPPAPSAAFGVFALVEDSFSAVTLPGTYPTRGHVRRLLAALGAA